MKEYYQIEDLPIELKNELKDSASFFDNFEGKSLDEQQRIACILNDCDLEIIAGAGTGKTHTLLAKAEYLIEKKNISPDDILFLSFSKSCVEELIEKLNYNVPTSTIHSFGLSLINEYRDKEVYDGRGFKKIFEEYLKTASDKQIDDITNYCENNLNSHDMIKFLVENKGIFNNFKYIFVDEYQDISYKNFQFIKTLKQACNAHLVVVGDDWQSIYGFRDSDITLFNDFCDYFPNANRVFIEKTYRNPQELIDIAGNFIMKNESQFKKSLKSDKSIEKPVKIIFDRDSDSIYNLIYNLSKDNERVFILGRYNGDIDKFIFDTGLVKKSKGSYKQITNDYESIKNVEYRTIHKAKGLEADYVVLINVFNRDWGFPNKFYPPYFVNLIQDWDYDKKLEEERRLFYVAITRAKKGVYIFTEDYNQSEYIDELIDENNLELIYSDDFNRFKEFDSVEEEDVKANLIDLSDFDNSEGIEIKANQKDFGNKLLKSRKYDEAEDFYKKLITNMYFFK